MARCHTRQPCVLLSASSVSCVQMDDCVELQASLTSRPACRKLLLMRCWKSVATKWTLPTCSRLHHTMQPWDSQVDGARTCLTAV